jgi:hypothetical protein
MPARNVLGNCQFTLCPNRRALHQSNNSKFTFRAGTRIAAAWSCGTEIVVDGETGQNAVLAQDFGPQPWLFSIQDGNG